MVNWRWWADSKSIECWHFGIWSRWGTDGDERIPSRSSVGSSASEVDGALSVMSGFLVDRVSALLHLRATTVMSGFLVDRVLFCLNNCLTHKKLSYKNSRTTGCTPFGMNWPYIFFFIQILTTSLKSSEKANWLQNGKHYLNYFFEFLWISLNLKKVLWKLFIFFSENYLKKYSETPKKREKLTQFRKKALKLCCQINNLYFLNSLWIF
jgi:hypothetical protein